MNELPTFDKPWVGWSKSKSSILSGYYFYHYYGKDDVVVGRCHVSTQSQCRRQGRLDGWSYLTIWCHSQTMGPTTIDVESLSFLAFAYRNPWTSWIWIGTRDGSHPYRIGHQHDNDDDFDYGHDYRISSTSQCPSPPRTSHQNSNPQISSTRIKMMIMTSDIKPLFFGRGNK